MESHFMDIQDADKMANIFKQTKPEIVFHLAAQPLVRRSYANPLETWRTNVLGTVNLLEACRHSQSTSAVVVITSDKCYENNEWLWGYRESDRLGGHDPYSASKAVVELVAASYRHSFFDSSGALLATARAGNVIGGGDWSEDRLIPDIYRAVAAGKPLEIRSPQAKRPWQHVLESLNGYFMLGQKLLEGQRQFAGAWNFGPSLRDSCTVEDVVRKLLVNWPDVRWSSVDDRELHEANLLILDSTKAQKELGWQSIWSLEQTLVTTAAWYQTYLEEQRADSHHQLLNYIHDASGIYHEGSVII
jgi:CDP-glucose 4,6-dehydratase